MRDDLSSGSWGEGLTAEKGGHAGLAGAVTDPAAHAAKGAAASAGAVVLADLCKNLEHSAAKQDWDATDHLTVEIAAAFKDIRAFINDPHTRGS